MTCRSFYIQLLPVYAEYNKPVTVSWLHFIPLVMADAVSVFFAVICHSFLCQSAPGDIPLTFFLLLTHVNFPEKQSFHNIHSTGQHIQLYLENFLSVWCLLQMSPEAASVLHFTLHHLMHKTKSAVCKPRTLW